MVSGIVPGEAAVPVDSGQDGAGEGHVGGGPGGVEAPVAGGARVPGEVLEDGGEDDDTADDDDTAEGVVTEGVDTEGVDGDGLDDEMP